MFTTFSRGMNDGENKRQHSNANSTRQKRQQVTRACDWCRVHRIKCDNNFPCHNCRNRGRSCSSPKKKEPRSLPQALREIEQLQLRIKDLESQLIEKDCLIKGSASDLAYSPTISATIDHERRPRVWEGIHTSSAQPGKTQFYGPASSFYFISRMSSYLASAFQRPHLDHHIQPHSASRFFASPVGPRKEHIKDGNFKPIDLSSAGVSLSRSQEEYFLGMYWQSYHCTMPILDESEFRKHYESLWDGSNALRKQSALVDIVLALCLQYGMAFFNRRSITKEAHSTVDSNDATIAGRWHYQRCQTLLVNEMESPSIKTVQSQLLCVIYVCNGSFQNTAHSTLALAVRNAQILGLHLEPIESLPLAQKELQRRLWWTLYAIEVKTCMKLGRPWSADVSQMTCNLPSDGQEAAGISGSDFASFGKKVTWLTFGSRLISLLMTVRSIHSCFYDKCNGVLANGTFNTLYDDPKALETCADFLLKSMKALQSWSADVPEPLTTRRKESGASLSTDRTPLDIENFAPLWVQRQRLVLELLYHHCSINLYRPFICFSQKPKPCMPYAERAATSCVDHAITLTQMMYQVLKETDILNGWHECYQWQWNATIVLIGFVLAYPVSNSTASARKAIDKAIGVFETFGSNFAIAASAANVAKDLTQKADFLVDQLKISLFGPYSAAGEESSILPTHCPATSALENIQVIDLENSMDLAFTVDSFTNFENAVVSEDLALDNWSSFPP